MKLGNRNSLSNTAPYSDEPSQDPYTPHDDPSKTHWDDSLQYSKDHLPILVNVIQKYETDSSGNRVLHPDSGAITTELIEEMISDVGEMMEGTYRNKSNQINVGGMTPIVDNPYHGLGLNYGIKLAEFIPANYFNYWLYRHDNPVKTPTSISTGTKTNISFDVAQIESGGNSNHQMIFDAAKNNLKTAGATADTAYATHGGQDLLDIKNYGGLVKTNGIFFYDIEEFYDPSTLRANRTAIDGSDPGACLELDPFVRLHSELANNSFNYHDSSDHQPCGNHVTNSFPGLVLWIYDSGGDLDYKALGNAQFPDMADTGTIWMQGSFPELVNPIDDAYYIKREKMASTLLHEIGHCLGLRHSFEGGQTINYSPIVEVLGVRETIQPPIETPAINTVVQGADTYNSSPSGSVLAENSQLLNDTVFNVERFNTLDADEKTFIEYFYNKFLPSYTRGVYHDELVDHTKDFTTHVRLPRTTYTAGDGSTTIVKSINTAVNSIKHFDWSVSGITDFDEIITKYGPQGFGAACKRLDAGYNAAQELPFWWTGSYHDTIVAPDHNSNNAVPVSGVSGKFYENAGYGNIGNVKDATGVLTSGLPSGAIGGYNFDNTAGTDYSGEYMLLDAGMFPFNDGNSGERIYDNAESNSMSVAFWVKFDDVSTNQVILSKPAASLPFLRADHMKIGLFTDTTDSNKYKISVLLKGSNETDYELGRVCMGDEWTSTDWNHVIITLEPATNDGEDDTKAFMYLNGTNVNINGYLFGDDDTYSSAKYRRISQHGIPDEEVNAPSVNNPGWLVGQDWASYNFWDFSLNGAGEVFDGSLTELAMWNKTLTDIEVAAIWNSGTPIDLASSSISNYSSTAVSNLLGYFRFYEYHNEQAVNSLGSGVVQTPLGGGKQLVVNKTDGNGNLIVDVRTRIPFCIPNLDGTPSEDFDEMWMYNMNWLNPDYPPYPDDWPTNNIYDQYEDDGSTPLCPCLYADQTYSNTWVPSTTIQASDLIVDGVNGNKVLRPATKGMSDVAIQESKRDFGYTLWKFFVDRDDYSHVYATNEDYGFPAYDFYGDSHHTGNASQHDMSNFHPLDGQDFFADSFGRSSHLMDWSTFAMGSQNYYTSYSIGTGYSFSYDQSSTYLPTPMEVNNEYWHESKNVYGNHYIAPYDGGSKIANNNLGAVKAYEKGYSNGLEEAIDFNVYATSTHKNGYMPDFGFYGFGPRTSPPSDYISNMTLKVYEDTLGILLDPASNIYDTYTNDNIRELTWGTGYDQQMLPLVIRFFTGSTDPDDYFYNPFKLDLKNAKGGTISPQEWYGIDKPNIFSPTFSDGSPKWGAGDYGYTPPYRSITNFENPPLPPISTAILSDDYKHERLQTPWDNPLNGKMWKGNPLGPGQLCNAMNYNRMIPIPEYKGRYVCSYNYLGRTLLSQDAHVPGLTNNPKRIDEGFAAGMSAYTFGDDYDSHNINRWGYHGGMSCFSKAGAIRAQQSIELNKGKCKGMRDYGLLISKYHSDLIADYGSHDAEKIRVALEKYLGTT